MYFCCNLVLCDFLNLRVLKWICVDIGISYLVSIVAPESMNQLIGVVIVFSLTCFAGGMPPLASLDHKVIPLRYFYHAS